MLSPMKSVVTGGAGFIGSHLVDELHARGDHVVVIDNFSTGQQRFLSSNASSVLKFDLLDQAVDLREHLEGADRVFHLAANADVRFGWKDPSRDLNNNLLATVRLAEAAKSAGVRRFIFSSTGAVYGEPQVFPTPEHAPFPVQTSLYGASKAAAEGFLAAFAQEGAFKVTVHRFVSVLGPRYMHGHVIDFVRQLMKDPRRLVVLGNGRQKKSYMHVADCVKGLVELEGSSDFEVFNLGADDYCSVIDSVTWICDSLQVSPSVIYGTDDRGWIGDNPFTFLDISRAIEHGWHPSWGIQAAIRNTATWLRDHPWVLEANDIRK